MRQIAAWVTGWIGDRKVVGQEANWSQPVHRNKFQFRELFAFTLAVAELLVPPKPHEAFNVAGLAALAAGILVIALLKAKGREIGRMF